MWMREVWFRHDTLQSLLPNLDMVAQLYCCMPAFFSVLIHRHYFKLKDLVKWYAHINPLHTLHTLSQTLLELVSWWSKDCLWV